MYHRWAMKISFLLLTWSPSLLAFALFYFFPAPAAAAIVNRTIDDVVGDSVTGQLPLFLGPGWNNQSCGGCAIKPDIALAFKNTYTAATYIPSRNQPAPTITMAFNGIAIWVFFILANNVAPEVTTVTLANFTLDDNEPELFIHTPGETNEFDYNATAFSKTGLLSTNHTLLISVSGTDNNVFLNFDYAVYTHDDNQGSPTTISSSLIAPTSTKVDGSSTSGPSASSADPGKRPTSLTVGIISGCVGGAIFVMILVCFVLFRRNRRRRNREMDGLQAAAMFDQQIYDGLGMGESELEEPPPRYTKQAC